MIRNYQLLNFNSIFSEIDNLISLFCFSTCSPDIFARLGDTKLKNNNRWTTAVEIKVENIIKHEKHDRYSKQNDIAVAKLARDVQFSDLIHPACLWQEDQLDTDSVVAIGWGVTDLGENRGSNDLIKVKINVFENDVCITKYEDQGIEFNENQICAGVLEGGKDTCNGGKAQITFNLFKY